MNTMLNQVRQLENKEWLLRASDRCDRCRSEALVRITGLSGELMFCNHHYNEIMNDPAGYKAMMSFTITLLDEREKLNEARPLGSV